MASGAPAIQQTPQLADNQRFLTHPFGPTLVLIQNVRSGKVLDVAGGSTIDGAPVIQSDWKGEANQIWYPLKVENLTIFRPYAFQWGERVRMRGALGRVGHVTPPAWSRTRRR